MHLDLVVLKLDKLLTSGCHLKGTQSKHEAVWKINKISFFASTGPQLISNKAWPE